MRAHARCSRSRCTGARVAVRALLRLCRLLPRGWVAGRLRRGGGGGSGEELVGASVGWWRVVAHEHPGAAERERAGDEGCDFRAEVLPELHGASTLIMAGRAGRKCCQSVSIS